VNQSAASETKPVVLKHATKIYPAGPAVHEVSFSVTRGEIFGLLGPNGAGKTTLLKIIAGLIRPTSGSILVFGQEASHRNTAILRRIGIVMDEPLTRGLSKLDALEYLRFFSRLYGVRSTREEIKSLLATFDLEESSRKPLGHYSRGMLQKLNLARAMIHSPDLLLLDEPTSGLDPQASVEFRKILLDLRDSGVTAVLSSHMLWDVEKVCDRVAIMSRGRVVYEGRLDDSFRPDQAKITIRVRSEQQESELVRIVNLAGVPAKLKRIKSGRRGRILLTIKNPEKANDLVENLIERRIEILSYEISSPTLEEIFTSTVTKDEAGDSDAGR